jgi:hypothetical protein
VKNYRRRRQADDDGDQQQQPVPRNAYPFVEQVSLSLNFFSVADGAPKIS